MDELRAALEKLGHSVVLVGPARTTRLEFGGDAGAVALLKRLLPRALYEMLEIGYNFVALPRLWLAIRRHRPDAIYERYNLFLLAGALLCRLHGVPLLLEVNAPICEERGRLDGLGMPRLAAWAERLVWRAADFTLPVTDVLAGYLRRAGVAEQRIAVIPNGIDPEKFSDMPDPVAARRRLGLDGRLVLGFTGFVRQWNSLDRVVDVLAEIGSAQNLHLLLVGDGPAAPALRRRAAERGVSDRLTITGIVARQNVAAHIAAFDIALQPGVTPYASPLKLLEYMAAGVAILAPDQSNIREILTDRNDALLVDPDRPEELSSAITELCSDTALRQQLGAAARDTIHRRRLTWRNNAEIVSLLIERNLDERQRLGRGRPAVTTES